MRYENTVLLIAFLALSVTVSAQVPSPVRSGGDSGQTPALETSLGYTYIHANAPPALCGCFSANGGYGSLVFNLPHGWSIAADLAAVHANTIRATTQSITLFNYLFGPRYTFRRYYRHFWPYGQALGGGEEEFSSYTAVQNVRGAAFSVGGGVNIPFNRHFGLTLFEADWVGARVPNAQNNLQNDFRLSSGVSFGFGRR